MSKQHIDLGTGYDTFDGDKLRDGGAKINENFDDTYRQATTWQAGRYHDYTLVRHNSKWYELLAGIPFDSIDFDQELANGDWKEFAPASEEETFTNPDPTPEDHGGIPAGSTFDEVPLPEMWQRELYPYQAPGFDSFDLDSYGSSLEVGQTIPAGAHTFSWSTHNDQNIVSNSLAIRDIVGNVVLESNIGNDGSEEVDFPADVVHDVVSTHNWEITGENSEGGNFSRATAINWLWRNFWGNDADGDITENDILSGSSRLDADGNGDYETSAASGVYKWVAYPASHGLAGRIIDANTGFDVAMAADWNPKVVPIENAFGVPVDMNVYRTQNQINGALTMQVSGAGVMKPRAPIPGTVPLTGIVAPVDDADKYPVTDEKYNLGGYRSVETIADRDAIPAERRKSGMLVYVDADTTRYKLDPDLTTWTVDDSGGGSGDFLPLDADIYQLNTNYTTHPDHKGNLIVALPGVTEIILDGANLDPGFQQIVFNRSGGNITIHSNTDTVEGVQMPLLNGYFAAYYLLEAGLWALTTPAEIGGGGGGGDMYKTIYDTDDSGIVDNSEALGGVLAANHALIDGTRRFTGSLRLGDSTARPNIEFEKDTGELATRLVSGSSGDFTIEVYDPATDLIANQLAVKIDGSLTIDDHIVFHAGNVDINQYFRKTEHVDYSAGVADRGKPIVLDSQGRISNSMIKLTTLYFVEAFTPVAGTEYPDSSGQTPGAFWIVDGLGDGIGFTFTEGDLVGQTAHDDDWLVLGSGGWFLRLAQDPGAYYRLDGTYSLTAPFAGGGQQIKDIVAGTEAGDGIEYTQFNTALDGKSDTDHTHTGYAPTDHDHVAADITDFQTAVSANSDVQHDNRTLLDALISDGLGTMFLADDGNYYAIGEGSISWGSITGTLSNQDDLQLALDGKSNTGHTHDEYAPIVHTHDEYALIGHNHDELYYRENEHISSSAGTGDQYKPIILNAAGQIDPSMIDASTFYYVGSFTPADGAEYPDISDETPGAFWVVQGLTDEYTFVGGELAGKPIDNGDFMVWGSGGWSIMRGEMNPLLYYKLDGSQAVTGAFAGGGFQIKNIIAGTVSGDGIEYDQFIAALAGKSDTGHDHDSDYAPIVHEHDDLYVPITGGTFDGDIGIINGLLKIGDISGSLPYSLQIINSGSDFVVFDNTGHNPRFLFGKSQNTGEWGGISYDVTTHIMSIGHATELTTGGIRFVSSGEIGIGKNPDNGIALDVSGKVVADDFNGVPLTAAGNANHYLAGDGNYKALPSTEEWTEIGNTEKWVHSDVTTKVYGDLFDLSGLAEGDQIKVEWKMGAPSESAFYTGQATDIYTVVLDTAGNLDLIVENYGAIDPSASYNAFREVLYVREDVDDTHMIARANFEYGVSSFWLSYRTFVKKGSSVILTHNDIPQNISDIGVPADYYTILARYYPMRRYYLGEGIEISADITGKSASTNQLVPISGAVHDPAYISGSLIHDISITEDILTGSGDRQMTIVRVTGFKKFDDDNDYIYMLGTFLNGDGVHLFRNTFNGAPDAWVDLGSIIDSGGGGDFMADGSVPMTGALRSHLDNDNFRAFMTKELAQGEVMSALRIVPDVEGGDGSCQMQAGVWWDQVVTGVDYPVAFISLEHRDGSGGTDKQVILHGGKAEDGAISKIGSKLHIGYSNSVPDFTRQEMLSVNGEIVSQDRVVPTSNDSGSNQIRQFWSGTQAEYTAIGTGNYDENTIYFIE